MRKASQIAAEAANRARSQRVEIRFYESDRDLVAWIDEQRGDESRAAWIKRSLSEARPSS